MQHKGTVLLCSAPPLVKKRGYHKKVDIFDKFEDVGFSFLPKSREKCRSDCQRVTKTAVLTKKSEKMFFFACSEQEKRV